MIAETLNELEFTFEGRPWRFHLGHDELAGGRRQPWLQVRFDAPCNVTGRLAPQHGRKWRLSE